MALEWIFAQSNAVTKTYNVISERNHGTHNAVIFGRVHDGSLVDGGRQDRIGLSYIVFLSKISNWIYEVLKRIFQIEGSQLIVGEIEEMVLKTTKGRASLPSRYIFPSRPYKTRVNFSLLTYSRKQWNAIYYHRNRSRWWYRVQFLLDDLIKYFGKADTIFFVYSLLFSSLYRV